VPPLAKIRAIRPRYPFLLIVDLKRKTLSAQGGGKRNDTSLERKFKRGETKGTQCVALVTFPRLLETYLCFWLSQGIGKREGERKSQKKRQEPVQKVNHATSFDESEKLIL